MMDVPVAAPHTPDEVYADLLTRLPGFEPGWSVGTGPAAALTRVQARFLSMLSDRLDLTPAKARLTFLDQLGISLLPAQPARAPVMFTLPSGAGDTRAPAGSQVSATVPGLDDPLVFETERDTGLAAARLVEVATVWPGRDAWADHSVAARSGSAFRLFDPLAPVPHELYFGHGLLLALSGAVTVDVTIELSQPAPVAMDTLWEYWDGEGWRVFRSFVPVAGALSSDSIDGTLGLTRSGTVRLVAECSLSQARAVAGFVSHWVRARLAGSLPGTKAGARPAIDRIMLRSVVAPSMGKILIAGPDGGEEKRLSVFASGLSGQGIDMTEAYAVLSELDTPDDPYPQQSLASGSAQWEGVEAGEKRLQVVIPGYTTLVTTLDPGPDANNYFLWTDFSGLALDRAVNDGLPVDLTTTFHPFGQNPQVGSVFAVAFDEAMTRPGAEITLQASGASTGQLTTAPAGVTCTPLTPTVVAEYFDGRGWRDLGVASSALVDLFTTAWQERITFTVPRDVASTEVAGVDATWIRFRITDQTFAANLVTTWKDAADDEHEFRVMEPRPPVLAALRGGYIYRSPQVSPAACLTHNDFEYVDQTAAARDRGGSFEPFAPVRDTTPTLYAGFDRRLPADIVSMYLDLVETEGVTAGQALAWEHWDGSDWAPVSVHDETAHLALPGVVAVVSPGTAVPPVATLIAAGAGTAQTIDVLGAALFRAGDLVTVADDTHSDLVTVASVSGDAVLFTTPLANDYTRATLSLAGLPRFGTPRADWLRARLRIDGEPRVADVGGIFLNTTWVSQVATTTGEVLGGSTGQPHQVLNCRRTPVLPGQVLEVRELSGPRAELEREVLRADVVGAGLGEDAIRVVTDRRTGAATEVWVRWQERGHLHFSGPGERHYVVERSAGRFRFGDDRHGRIPPADTDNLRLASYLSGGGANGNVRAGAINQLLAGVMATGVANVRAAEGGADGETVDAVPARGSGFVRSHGQALTLADYESLARQAAPAVAVARAQPMTDARGRRTAGWVRVTIVPHSNDPRPMPSFGLRRMVSDFLRARCPAAVGSQVSVTSPTYYPVGVAADVVPVDLDRAGAVVLAVTEAVTALLHPLGGGPDGKGWPFGRGVHASDLARVMERVPGVDHLATLELLVDGIPVGDRVVVPEDRIVVAGQLRLRVSGGEA